MSSLGKTHSTEAPGRYIYNITVVSPRSNSLRHPLALELHNKLAPRPQLLGEAQEARAGRSRKGGRVQVVLHPLEPLLEVSCRHR